MSLVTSLVARRAGALAVTLALALASCAAPGHDPSEVAAAEASFARLAALEGDWVVVDGSLGEKGAVLVNYRVSAAGSAVVETLFPGQGEEMITVYTRDGGDLVLTHYCALGNQPRMRASSPGGDVLQFEFEGGHGIDPTRDDHMHSGRLEFVSADELRTEWQAWSGGKPAADHKVTVHLARKKG
jgi:hypothetical protein